MPSCLECKGACCEEFNLPDTNARDDASRWFALHGRVTIPGKPKLLTFECKCTVLSPDGSCLIYPDRPYICRDYKNGGPSCLEVIQRRRTREERKRILGEN